MTESVEDFLRRGGHITKVGWSETGLDPMKPSRHIAYSKKATQYGKPEPGPRSPGTKQRKEVDDMHRKR